jgi:predicted DNA-binding antitoxin AbrB/MazE fold protein
MSQIIRAIYENGVLRPLEELILQEHEQVRVTIESPSASNLEDPLAGLRVQTGVPDLAEHFDVYRFGRRTP